MRQPSCSTNPLRPAVVARVAVVWVLVAAACSVPNKTPADPDAGGPGPGGDAGIDGPPDDTSAPDTTLDQAPGELTHSNQVTIRFSSSDPRATFSCRLDQDAAQPCVSPYVRTLADGPHGFSVHAVDAAGNADDTPAECVWTIDTAAPETELTDTPPSADNSTTVTFAFRSNEANALFDCSLDNAGYAPCDSGAPVGPIGDGSHSFAVRARDRAGNIDPSPAVFPWFVDTRTPDTEITSAPRTATQDGNATFAFLSQDAGANATFECKLDGGAFVACTSPRAYTGLGEGAHGFAVRVRDALGNVDPSPATRAWTVDVTPPETTVTGPTGAVPVASASIMFSASETNAAFACALDDGAAAPCTSPVGLTGLGQGAHSFSVTATDAAGNTDGTAASVAWTVDTVAPEIAITGGPAAASTVGPRVVLGFTVSDGAIVCSFDGGAFAACASPVATNLAAGTHQFAVRATDGVGNVATVTRGWTVACGPPDAANAAGVLHLDDGGQTVANAVAGGAGATLGDTPDAEPADPAALPGGRFGGGLSFTAAEGDHVAWPIALAAMPDLTLELWSRPTAASGPGDLAVSGDGRVALRVIAASPTTVQFSISIAEDRTAGEIRTVTSAPVAGGTWHHVLASLQQPVLRLWVDGVRTDVGTVQLVTPPALDALRLGGEGVTAYDGALDEVWIAQTAITSDEPALARYCPL